MELNEQITKYCEQKEEEKALHKSNETLNQSIKETLQKSSQTSSCAGQWTVELETRTSESMDASKMLTILKKFWEETHKGEKCPFIRTQEYLDEDALESFMYKEDLPKELLLELDGCRKVTKSVALTYKKAKGE